MRNLTWRQIAVVLGCVLAVATVAVGVYGLVRGPGATSRHPPLDRPGRSWRSRRRPLRWSRSRTAHSRTRPIRSPTPAPSRPRCSTGTPARLPADRLHRRGPGRRRPLRRGDARPDRRRRDVPADRRAVARPRGDGGRQTIEIDDAYVPDSWTAAVQQAHGHLRPGTTAVTITGTRHRSGVWNGEPAESSYPVSFTVFVACEPSFDRCHVLRLSQLDNPLQVTRRWA